MAVVDKFAETDKAEVADKVDYFVVVGNKKLVTGENWSWRTSGRLLLPHRRPACAGLSGVGASSTGPASWSSHSR